MHAALIVCGPTASDVTGFLHASQHAGHAGTRNGTRLAYPPLLRCRQVEKYSHDPPLLLGESVRVENGSKIGSWILSLATSSLVSCEHEWGRAQLRMEDYIRNLEKISVPFNVQRDLRGRRLCPADQLDSEPGIPSSVRV